MHQLLLLALTVACSREASPVGPPRAPRVQADEDSGVLAPDTASGAETSAPSQPDGCSAIDQVCVVAGLPGEAGWGADGQPARATRLHLPQDVAVAPDGRWWIADFNNHAVREVSALGFCRVVAGTGFPSGGDGGPALKEPLHHPSGLTLDPNQPDHLWIALTSGHRVARLELGAGQITYPFGTGASGFEGDGGPAASASLNRPSSVAIDPSGVAYISDRLNQVVREVGGFGVIQTVAGQPGVAGYAGDGGPADLALLAADAGAAWDPANRLTLDGRRLLIADSANGVIRAIDLDTRVITTLADGFAEPHDLAMGPSATLYVVDTADACVRAVGPNGQVWTAAGRCGEPGPAVEATSADEARFYEPGGLTVDRAGFLWIADTGNHVIRRVRPSGPPQEAGGG
jgi:sugar lactone lactonase YvrE